MEQHYFYQIIEQYGIYAVFALCTIEGDITLLISGVLAHSRFFGDYSFFKVFAAGVLGGVAGDSFGYWVGRIFAKTIRDYKFYQRAQPRIERLVDKFGGAAIIISKYIYGIRVAICISSGVGKMPFARFLFNDVISCSVWVLILSGLGYFFSGAITSIIGDFPKIGIALLLTVVLGISSLYLLERFWLSKKIEEADPATIHKIEEKIHDIEDRLHIPHRHDEKLVREKNRQNEKVKDKE